MIYIGNCADRKVTYIAETVKEKGKRLNKTKFHKMLKEQYPDIFEYLGLNYHNPYNYYQNNKYYVLIHSAIEYVFEKEKIDENN